MHLPGLSQTGYSTTRDSSAGRAEDCRRSADILRSVVQVRLAGSSFRFGKQQKYLGDLEICYILYNDIAKL